ncbi:FGF16 (predicted) [Pycnogonum litorale]
MVNRVFVLVKARRFRHYPRPVQMYCSNGFHLQMFSNGRVNGTREDHSPYGIIEVINEASNGIVSIRGLESKRYLCMNSRGRLKAEKRRSMNCIFKQEMQPNHHNTYYLWKSRLKRSQKYYIAINRKGRMRKGHKTKRKHRSAHFLLRGVDPNKIPRKLFRKYMRRIRRRIKRPKS